MKHRVTDGYPVVLLLFVETLKSKTGGSRPARRLTFVHAATKVSKNALLLAEGIFLCQFPVLSFRVSGWEPARYRGPHDTAFLTRWPIVALCSLNERRTLAVANQSDV